MFLLPMILTTLTAGSDVPVPASDAIPSREQVRRAVQRGVVFLEKSGTGWFTSTKCASCHHVPISIWGLNEARRHGIAVNDKALDQLWNWAVPPYASNPKLRPAPMDQEKIAGNVSVNTVYLIQATVSADKLDEKAAETVKKFAAHLLAGQEADGSWQQSSVKLPPVLDVTEVRTMQVLMALAAAEDKGLLEPARWAPARDRALAWLGKHTFLEQNQSLNLRVLVAKRFGKPDEVRAMMKQLLQQQETDGGWSQAREAPGGALKDYEGKKTGPAPSQAEKRPSDALATGQTLYALTVAGLDLRHPALQRARAYLVRTQTQDGSWRVPIRAQKNTGNALSHYGTGWAIIGLTQTLAAPAGRQELPGGPVSLPRTQAQK